MDVAKPGKTPASATSRPVIVSHGPAIKDPMVTDDTKPDAEESQSKESLSKSHKVIAPLTFDDSKNAETSKLAEKPEPVQDKPDETPADDTSDAVVDAVLDQVADKKEGDKEEAARQKRQELVDALVESKKYFLPINSVKRKRNNMIAIVILAAILPLVIGVWLAIDAKLILPDVTLPIDLIK